MYCSQNNEINLCAIPDEQEKNHKGTWLNVVIAISDIHTSKN